MIANAGLDPFNVSSHRRYIHKLPLETDPPPAGNVRARVRRARSSSRSYDHTVQTESTTAHVDLPDILNRLIMDCHEVV